LDAENAVVMQNITKYFGDVAANDDVSLSIRKGEILSLLGENGSGKTTLMNMLSGIYYPDSGRIEVMGKEAAIRSPKDAFALGIGMLHQHFKLVDVLTVSENIVLGLNEGCRLNLKAVSKRIRDICAQYGFSVEPDKKIYELSVSEKQTVEIVKLLYRGASILILDEPTAVLTPQETARLFEVLRNMRDDGKAIVLITHKMHEILEVSDRVAVMRRGKYVGTVDTVEADVHKLAEMMVGRTVSLNIERSEPVDVKKRLVVDKVSCYNEHGLAVLDEVSFTAYGGEILGIAGISGSGQKELLEAIAGLQRVAKGSIGYFPEGEEDCVELVGMGPAKIRELGVQLSFVPEDRLGMGLVGSMDITENMMLRSYASGNSMIADRKTPKGLAEKIIRELEVVTPGTSTPVRFLSGGNVQKVLVGREIAASPKVLMTAYAVRGLDINTSYTIYRLLGEQKKKGTAVIYVGEDLDVLLELCDRIIVLRAGRVSAVVDARSIGKNEIGMLMTYQRKEEGSDGHTTP